jgi:excisionase family DNA binding protein
MIQLALQLPEDHDPPEAAAVEYLTIAEAARRVRCCKRTIRRAIDSGALRAGRIRGARGSRGGFRIRPADLDVWMFSDDS